MVVSLAASVAVWALYVIFYRDWDRGAGVHRTFLLAGPAITVLFIAIQFSLPLSLGLLGALSFVRFRTPVKDPGRDRLPAAADRVLDRRGDLQL